MADEILNEEHEVELFQLSNGRYIMDEDQSRKTDQKGMFFSTAVF